jgi:hypothetical protein
LEFKESRYQGIYDYISMLMHGRTTDKRTMILVWHGHQPHIN